MHALITVLPGDGIGTEITVEAVRALEAVATRFGHRFEFESALLGGAAIDATGEALPDATLAACRRADAILLGAVGGPKWSHPDAKVRPEQGLLQLRKALGLFANLRPVVPHPAVLDASPIKAELLHGVDIMVVRELTGGIYFGDKQRTATEAVDWPPDLRVHAAASSRRSTRQMYWRLRVSGAPSSTASCRPNFPNCSSTTCSSMRPRCI